MYKKFVPVLALVSTQSYASDDQMEHVLVSVPIHKATAETALPVTVLNGEELRREAAATISETLAFQPGLSNASFGPGVGQPVIRGQQGPRVTVLQNGTLSADVSNSSADHAVAAEPLLATSVEVLRGPSTLLYGGGAIGGVLNILDNRIPTTAVNGARGGFEYRYDSASELNGLVGRIEAGNERFTLHASGLLRDWEEVEIPGTAEREPDPDEEVVDGIIENSDGETSQYNLGGAFHFEKGFFGLAYSKLDNEYGIPPGAHGHHHEKDEHHDDEDHHDEDEHHDEDLFADEDHHDEDEHHDEDDHEHGDEEEEEFIRIDMAQKRYDANLHLHDAIPGIEVFRGFLTRTEYEHVELEGEETGTRFENDTWETRLELVHKQIGALHGVIGLQWRDNEYAAIGEEAFVPLTDSEEFGLFIVEDLHRDNWTFEFGLRYDRVKRDPQDSPVAESRDFDNLSGSISALWSINEQLSLGAGLSSNERAPVTEELYSNVEAMDEEDLVPHAATASIEIGDQDLDQETSRNLDLSLTWQPDWMTLSASIFYNDFKDYIALANTGLEVDELPVLQYVQDDAEFYGGEIRANMTLAEVGSGRLGLILQGDVVRGELDQLGDVPRLPPARVGAELNWGNQKLFTFLRALHATEQDKPGMNEEPTDAYTRWDAGIEYMFGSSPDSGVKVFLKGKNLTDEEIRLSTSYLRDLAPEPGRSIEAGLRVMF